MALSSFKERVADRAQRMLRPIAPLIRAANLWMDVDGPRMSAAMSFYGMLSLAPLLLLLVGVMGWWIDKAYLETNLIAQVQHVVGDRGADAIRVALASAQEPSQGRLASLFGFALLLSGATGVFVELQSALERLWLGGQPPAPQTTKAWWRMASLRLRGLGYVLAIGFLLLVSLVVSTGINMVGHWASGALPMGSGTLLLVVNELVAFAIAVGLFVGLMRIGGGPKPSMICLVFGAVVGAILFTVGKQLLALYLSTAAVVSAYGAAGSLVVLLMWIFFSSAVLLFSAACARALQEVREANAQHTGLPREDAPPGAGGAAPPRQRKPVSG